MMPTVVDLGRIWLGAILLVAAAGSWAAQVPEAERIPVDVRRTTLLVNDAEAALALYRDALGLVVIYDQVLQNPLPDEPGKLFERRLVLLRGNDDFIGVLGLLEYRYPPKPQRQERFDTPVPGDPIIVINADNFDSVWPRVTAVPGVQVISEPGRIEYPRAGGGIIPVIQTMIRDPDGYWLEINRILSAPAAADDGQQ
jgi:catechol 2,3-dioxygenase-like lactoylglutathione lyase family enzyme